MIGLSAGQKNRIQQKSDDLAVRIEKFVRESRQEAFDIVMHELSKKQRDKFKKLYNIDRVKRQFSLARMSILYEYCVFDFPKGYNTEVHSDLANQVATTKIKDKSANQEGRVSRQQYPDPLLRDLISSYSPPKRNQLSVDYSSILAIVQLIADEELKDADFAKSLSLTETQNNKINDLFKEYRKEIANAELSDYDPRKFGNHDAQIQKKKNRLIRKLNEDVNSILMPHQLEFLSNMNLSRKGLPKMLAETPIGDLIGLSDGQKQRIEHQADKLAKKIEKTVHELRQEAFDIVIHELTAEQRLKFEKMYNLESIKQLVSQMTMGMLYQYYAFELPEGYDKRIHGDPIALVAITEIKDEE